MLVGICGGICSGKSSVVDFLVKNHRFRRLSISPTSQAPFIQEDPEDGTITVSTKQSTVDKCLEFATIEELRNFVTPRWNEPWVTTSIHSQGALDALLHRPFFLLLSIDAPVHVRWLRYKSRCIAEKLDAPSLHEFVQWSDEHLFTPVTGLAALLQHAQLRLLNATSTVDELHKALNQLDIPNEARLRPNWDQYFMQLAALAAHRSNCMKRRVGCVLVREKRVISTGYNGTPKGLRNCNEGGCDRCNSGLQIGLGLSACLCLHAEENALLEAGRERIGSGSILYCNTCPCLTCSIKISQVGITEVVYNYGYAMDTATAAVFQEAGVGLRQFTPVPEGLVDLSALLPVTSRRA